MRFISFLGLFFLLGVAWLLSSNRSKIRPRVIIWGVGLQLLFALIILSQNRLSMAGMFILLCMILVFIHSDHLFTAPSLSKQALVVLGIAVGAAAISAAFVLLEGVGFANLAALILLGVIGFGFYQKMPDCGGMLLRRCWPVASASCTPATCTARSSCRA